MSLDKILKPLTPEIFKQWFSIGFYLRMRNISKDKACVSEAKLLYNGHIEYNDGLFTVVFGHRTFTFEELFNEWEFYNVTTNSWKRFAI